MQLKNNNNNSTPWILKYAALAVNISNSVCDKIKPQQFGENATNLIQYFHIIQHNLNQ